MAENRAHGGAKSGFDVSTALGLGLGFGAILFAFIAEEGMKFDAPLAFVKPPPGTFVPTAILIVLGGTIGALFVSFPSAVVAKLPTFLGIAFKEHHEDLASYVTLFVDLAGRARREGLLSLDEAANAIENKFLRRGLQLIVDGTAPDTVRAVMESEIQQTEARHKQGIELFGAAGGFAPTMGIIGTVMSLVSVLAKLSDPNVDLGASIATAFIATLWGVVTANLFWLPIGVKLKEKNNHELEAMRLMVEGVVTIAESGGNARVVEELLKGFLPAQERARAEAAGEAATAAA